MDRQDLRDKLLDILEQETWERPEILADHMTIRDGLKLDSVDVLSVALRVESELGVVLDSSDFGHILTAGDLLDAIQAKLAAQAKKAA
jgi:acyl carrier protein